MKTYVEGVLPELIPLARLASEMVSAIPSGHDPEGREIRCHEVARAVHLRMREERWIEPAYDSRVVDGLFDHVDHSWIVVYYTQADQWPKQAILDTYAVGAYPPVVLLDASPILRARNELYRERDPRRDIREETVRLLVWSTRNDLDVDKAWARRRAASEVDTKASP